MERQWLPSNFSEAPWLKQSMVKLGSLMAVPLFGPSKTICGIVLAVLATAGIAALSALADWCIDRDRGVAERSPGELREAQIGISAKQPGYRPRPIPSLIPFLDCRLLLPITAPDVAAATILFFAGELALSRLRDRPY